MAICLQLFKQLVCRAFSRALAKTGKRIAAKMAMMAMTTNSSMSVKPRRMGLPPWGKLLCSVRAD